MKTRTFEDLYREAESHDDYWLAGIGQGFTEALFALMEQQGISRSELARRLGSSPAYVTKILRGNTNFTLATMSRLSRAVGADLRIQLEPRTPASGEQVPGNLAAPAGSGS